MHDLDRVRDKIEVRLEPRQVVALGIGTMVFSGLLFAGGYYLGQHQAEPQLIQQVDATFATDRDGADEAPAVMPVVAAVGEVEFLFPNALGSRPARRKKVRRSMRLPAEVVRATGAPAARPRPSPPTRRAASPPTPALEPPDPPDPKPTVSPPVGVDEDAPAAMGGNTSPKAVGDARAVAASDDSIGRPRPVDVTSPDSIPAPATPPSNPTAKTTPADAPPSSPSPPASGAEDTPPPPSAPSDPPVKSAVTSGPVAAKLTPEDAPAPPPMMTTQAQKTAPPVAASSEDDATNEAKPASKPAPGALPKTAPARTYTLQVKAARDKGAADAFVEVLRAKGFKPHLILVDLPEKGRFYRVRLGRFDSMPEARAFQRRYKATSGHPDGGFVTDL